MNFPRALTLPALTLASLQLAHGQSVLQSLPGTGGGDQFGTAAVAIGDVDGDGAPEVAISAPAGSGASVELRNTRTGALIWRRSTAGVGTGFGYRMEALGDLNGDGFTDLLVSSPGDSTGEIGAGAIRVLSGTNGAILREWFGSFFDENMGHEIAALGDIDGDGFPDFAFAAYNEPNPSLIALGSVTVRSALTGADIHRIIEPNGEYVDLGSALANVGDLDNDGINDFIVGSDWNRRTGVRVGAADVYSGSTGAVLLEIDGTATDENFGTSAGAVGDYNADGTLDVIVGSPYGRIAGTPYGKFGVYSGIDGALLFEAMGETPFAQFGTLVGSAGDMNGDGRPEIYSGSPGSTQSGNRPGQVSVFNRDGERLFRMESQDAFDGFGHAYAAGDIDGDGLGDLFVGAIRHSNGSGSGRGRVDIVTLDPLSGGILCAGLPNSTGMRSRLAAESASDYLASANDLTLRVTDLPTDVLGYFLVSRGDGIVLLAGTSEGRLCISSNQFGRYSQFVLSSGATGEVSLSPDTSAIPLATSGGAQTFAAQPGDTYNFQLWHRDRRPGGVATDNFSDAVTVTFR